MNLWSAVVRIVCIVVAVFSLLFAFLGFEMVGLTSAVVLWVIALGLAGIAVAGFRSAAKADALRAQADILRAQAEILRAQAVAATG